MLLNYIIEQQDCQLFKKVSESPGIFLYIWQRSFTGLNKQWQKVHAIELQDWTTEAVLAFRWAMEGDKGIIFRAFTRPSWVKHD